VNSSSTDFEIAVEDDPLERARRRADVADDAASLYVSEVGSPKDAHNGIMAKSVGLFAERVDLKQVRLHVVLDDPAENRERIVALFIRSPKPRLHLVELTALRRLSGCSGVREQRVQGCVRLLARNELRKQADEGRGNPDAHLE
jgi:hypothetical protein